MANAKKTVAKTITVAGLAKEMGIDPKKARARLRKQGWSAEGKRYPELEVGSKRHEEAVAILS